MRRSYHGNIQNGERQTDELQDVLTIIQHKMCRIFTASLPEAPKQASVAEMAPGSLEGGESSAKAFMEKFLAVPEKRQYIQSLA